MIESKENKKIPKTEETIKTEETKKWHRTEIEEITQDNIAEIVFFNANEIIERYKIRDGESKNELNAMHYLKDLFMLQMIMPGNKKVGRNYVNDFFFFNIMEVNEGFAQGRLNVNEMHKYMIKYSKKYKYAFNLNNLKKCYVDSKDEMGCTCFPIARDKVAEVRFPRVYLDKEYVLDKIADYTTMLIKKYWKAMKGKEKVRGEKENEEHENMLVELHRDICVCQVLYEIFIKEFFAEEWELNNEYNRISEEAGMWMEKICSGNLIGEEAEEFVRWKKRTRLQADWFWLIRMLYKHERMYFAVAQCMAFIGILNVEMSLPLKVEKKIKSKNDCFDVLIFSNMGNKTKKVELKMAKEILEKSPLFDAGKLDENHPTVKKIFAFLEQSGETRKRSGKEALEKLAWEISYPIMDRSGMVMKLDIQEIDYKKVKWKIEEAGKNTTVQEG